MSFGEKGNFYGRGLLSVWDVIFSINFKTTEGSFPKKGDFEPEKCGCKNLIMWGIVWFLCFCHLNNGLLSFPEICASMRVQHWLVSGSLCKSLCQHLKMPEWNGPPSLWPHVKCENHLIHGVSWRSTGKRVCWGPCCAAFTGLNLFPEQLGWLFLSLITGWRISKFFLFWCECVATYSGRLAVARYFIMQQQQHSSAQLICCLFWVLGTFTLGH